MEPADINTPPPDDWLDEALRKTGGPTLPDHDFSNHVLCVLPPPKARTDWRQTAYWTAVMLTVLACALSPGSPWFGLDRFRGPLHQALIALFGYLADPWTSVALALGALSLFYALRPTRRGNSLI